MTEELKSENPSEAPLQGPGLAQPGPRVAKRWTPGARNPAKRPDDGRVGAEAARRRAWRELCDLARPRLPGARFARPTPRVARLAADVLALDDLVAVLEARLAGTSPLTRGGHLKPAAFQLVKARERRAALLAQLQGGRL